MQDHNPAMTLASQCNLLLSTLGSRRQDEGTSYGGPGLLVDAEATSQPAEQYYAALQRRVHAIRDAPTLQGATELLLTGVQCLSEFVQHDLTGPSASYTPLYGTADQQDDRQSSHAAASGLGQDLLSPDERWVEQQLEVDGEDVVGRCTALDRLLAALLLLAEPLGYKTTGGVHAAPTWQPPQASLQATTGTQPANGASTSAASTSGSSLISASGRNASSSTDAFSRLVDEQLPSWHWWAMRAVLMQQEVVSGRSATLFTALQELLAATMAWVHGLEGQHQQQPHLVAAAHLEAAQVYHVYGHVTAAKQQLEQAAGALGLTVTLTGALGRRTVHQVDAKAQLVVQLQDVGAAASTGHSSSNGSNDHTHGASASANQASTDVDVAVMGFDDSAHVKELAGMQDESEVYIAPRIEQQDAQDGSQTQRQSYSSVEQALLLAWATQVHKGNAQDELAQWQAAPFVEAVLQQRHSQYMLQAAARLLKARHERERPRTRERALMQMESLATALTSAAPPDAHTRAPFAFAVRFPLRPLLRKELGEQYIGMGLVGAALRVFDELGMWDQLILCYQLLDKRQVARELIQQRLKVSPNEPRLWCALGDLDHDDTAYMTAWERSGQRSARAQRSLARSATRRKDWAAAGGHWERALGLSPMYPEGWFSLGYCRLKLEDNAGALQAFTKVTMLEPDNGEAWNNIAALWMQQQRWPQAFSALGQATKHKRDSWQTWENYAQAALHTGALLQAVRALAQVLELTSGQRLMMPLAARLVEALEEQQQAAEAPAGDGSSAAAAGEAAEEQSTADHESDDEPLVASEHLLGLLHLSGDVPTAPAGADVDAAAAAAAASDERSRASLLAAAGTVLKNAANAPACTPALWGLLARWHSLQGSADSAKEAWLKAVRGLQGTAYKADAEAFEAMADASVRLANAYMAVHTAGGGAGSSRDLAAARMHLRGVLRATEETFAQSEASARMRAALEEVMQLEAQAAAQKAAASAQT